MPGLSYPFVFECEECGTEATVTRAEAQDLYPNPDPLTAVDEVLQQEKGWTNGERGAYPRLRAARGRGVEDKPLR